MATAGNNPSVSITLMEEDLSCYICYNILREPKELDCPHFYCLKCLQDWVGKEPTIDCPECRHITIVPIGGLQDLKTNLRLKAMSEKYTERVEKQIGVPMCPVHEGERQHFYCVTCGVTVCHNCLVLKHQRPQHEIQELKEITGERKKQTNDKLRQVQAKVQEIDILQKKLDDVENQVKTAVEMTVGDIDRRADEVIAQVQAMRKATKATARETSEKHFKMIRGQRSCNGDLKKRLNNVQSASQNAVDTAADHVYMKQHDSLVENMEKLCITKPVTTTSDLACLHFKSGSNSVSPEWFGEVVENEHREEKLTLVTEFGAFGQAQGVAKTKTGLIAVVDSAAKQVSIYREENGEYKRHMLLGDAVEDSDGKLTTPINVAATYDGNFLVIDDGGGVKVYSSTGKYKKTLPISGTRITTTPDHDRIVIGSRRRREFAVYQPGGELLKKHKINSGNLQDIACNGKQIAVTTGSENKLFVIDIETGQELWSLGTTWPLGVCYDQRSNSLLVAGGSTTQGWFPIEQRCITTGRLISSAASGLFNPYAMITIDDGKILVADMKTVKVYKRQ